MCIYVHIHCGRCVQQSWGAASRFKQTWLYSLTSRGVNQSTDNSMEDWGKKWDEKPNETCREFEIEREKEGAIWQLDALQEFISSGDGRD